MARATKGLQRSRLRGGEAGERMEAQADRSCRESRILPSGPNCACNQPEEKYLHRKALWEMREETSYQGDFLLGLPMWNSLIILEGVLLGKGNKSDGEAGEPADEAR